MSRSVRNGLALFVSYFLVLEVMLALAMEFWPDFQQVIAPFQLLARAPVLRNWIDLLKDGGLPAYVVFQHFFKGCNFLGVATAVLMAVTAVAGEAHRGTLEILLARPESRTRLLLRRVAAGATILVTPVFLSSWTTPWLLSKYDAEIALEPLMLCAVHQSAFLLAIYTTSVLCSTVSSHPTRLALGLLFAGILQFALYFLMEATHWSIVRLVEPRMFVRMFETRQLDWGYVGGMLAYSALALVVAVVLFRRRSP